MRRAFTLVELLVVVAIIVVLLAMLAPAMESAMEQARRAKCGAHQKHVGVMTAQYTTENKGHYFITYQRTKPFYMGTKNIQTRSGWNDYDDRNVDWPAAMATVGLFEKSKDPSQYNLQPPAKVWTCPNVKVPAYWINNTHALVHFQYMGGFNKWETRPEYKNNLPSQVRESSSPVNRTTSRGSWVLLAELNGIANYYTTGSTEWWNVGGGPFFGIPPHPDSPNGWPAGGNQNYVDGSVAWIPFHEWVFVHAYNPHAYFMAQKDLGNWVPPDGAKATAWMRKTR